MRDAVALLKLGVPFDIAHAMTWDEALAYRIIAGEIEGGEWDWGNMGWRER